MPLLIAVSVAAHQDDTILQKALGVTVTVTCSLGHGAYKYPPQNRGRNLRIMTLG